MLVECPFLQYSSSPLFLTRRFDLDAGAPYTPRTPRLPHTRLPPNCAPAPQVMLGLMVQPPVKGDASSVIYEAERAAILDSLKARAEMVNNSQ